MEEKKPTNTGSRSIDQGTKIVAGIGYLGILFIIPLIMAGQDQYKKDADFLKYHANQGLVLLITDIVLVILISVLTGMLLFSGLFFLMSLLSMAVWVGIIVLVILGFMNALNGAKKPLPVIGGITIIK